MRYPEWKGPTVFFKEHFFLIIQKKNRHGIFLFSLFPYPSVSSRKGHLLLPWMSINWKFCEGSGSITKAKEKKNQEHRFVTIWNREFGKRSPLFLKKPIPNNQKSQNFYIFSIKAKKFAVQTLACTTKSPSEWHIPNISEMKKSYEILTSLQYENVHLLGFLSLCI